jgi:hypothetical protein
MGVSFLYSIVRCLLWSNCQNYWQGERAQVLHGMKFICSWQSRIWKKKNRVKLLLRDGEQKFTEVIYIHCLKISLNIGGALRRQSNRRKSPFYFNIIFSMVTLVPITVVAHKRWNKWGSQDQAKFTFFPKPIFNERIGKLCICLCVNISSVYFQVA